MKPTTRHRVAVAAVAVAVLALLATAPASAERPTAASRPPSRGPIVRVQQIAPGLKFTRIVERQVPRRTFVLTVDLSKPLTLDVALTESTLPARRELSRVANQHDALAGINGDYGLGRPVHAFLQDGELLQTTSQVASAFAIARDESRVIFGKPEVAVTMTDRSSGLSYGIDRWNHGAPAPGEIAGYTPLGGTLEPPRDFQCSVRLLPTGPLELAPEEGVNRDFQVDAAGCSEDALERAGGVVISALPATDEATQLLAIAPGTAIRMHWTLGFPGVFDAVGGAPLMIEDGRILGVCNSGCGRQPRTGIGVTAGGRVLLVVVDGRQPRWSLGPTLNEFAHILQDLGAVTALNMDGGGSTEMVVDGEIVNRPSDGHQRQISNAVLVLPGPDPGEA